MSAAAPVPELAEVRARIKRTLIERLGIQGLAPEDIADEEALFGTGLGLDSVDALELVLGLEQEFRIRVRSQEIGREAFASVASLADFVRARLAAEPAARP
jgi:acyl carrier protein